MFEKFTEKAIRVIISAQEEARRLRPGYVGTEQILLGLLSEGAGVGVKLLESMGVQLSTARLEVEKLIGRGSGHVCEEIPLTPQAKSLLELSFIESRQRLRYIAPDHLLLALLAGDRNQTFQLSTHSISDPLDSQQLAKCLTCR
jgi:ATP-dependent Clp protease ATP-binding subunit ClpC